MSFDYDAIVIGSGFGGAVVAHRLAQKGRKVLVFERGRRWQPEDYPRGPEDAWVWDQEQPHHKNGWLDLRLFDDMAVAQGAGVGGGSLIYANIFVEAQPWVFESGWPGGISYASLKPHYDTVGQMLKVQEIPDNQLTRRFEMMRDAAGAIGAADRFRKLPLAVRFSENWNYDLPDAHADHHSETWTNDQGVEQGTCVHCGNCDIGCQVKAKNTLDLNYLAAAEKNGAEIRPLHQVHNIAVEGDGYRVYFDRLEDYTGDSLSAEKVIVAAGSLCSTELLLRCREESKSLPNLSPALGRGWSSNGDVLTPACYERRDLDPTRGPTITCAIDFLDGSDSGNRHFVEDGGFPPLVGNTLADLAGKLGKISPFHALIGKHLVEHYQVDRPVSHVMPWFGQGADAADGRLYLGRPWYRPFGKTKLQLDWNIAASEAAVQGLIDKHLELSSATDGDALVLPTWTLSKNLITPHPLGGCRMADSPRDGVVDAGGQVYHYPGFYVADGGIVPRALGLNPSRTIAALADYISEQMLATW